MILSDISVKRPVLAVVMSLVLILAGLVAFSRLSVREYPEVDPPIISVSTSYRGASAAVVESRVTQVIENQISGVEGIESIISRSRDGRSEISIEFVASRDLDSAANDVRDRIGTVLNDLPDEADPPEIRKTDADSQPIIWFQLSGKGWSNLQLSDYADRYLVDRFSSVDGVARVVVGGEARPSMRIWLDRTRLAALNLTAGDVEDALRAQNVELPAGRIETPDTNLTVKITRPFSTPQDFAQLVLRKSEDGYLVRLGDVARIEVGPENPYQVFRANGRPVIGMGIVRQSNANTLEVAQRAKARADEIQKQLPPGLDLAISFDTSTYIEAAIDNVWKTLAEAALLVVLVIYLFLGSARATLIPALTVPISLIGTFIVLSLFGFSINLLTLLALVLAIGLVVDDAIVVLENVHHRIEQGDTPLVAAFQGTRQVSFAVIASTVVVCAVFVPVMFISGNSGMLFRELAAAMIGALTFSGFVALSLTPMLCSKLLKQDRARSRLTDYVDRKFSNLTDSYKGFLQKTLNHPWRVGGLSLIIVLLCGAAATTLKSELAPEEDQGLFWVNILAPDSTGYDKISEYMIDVEKKFQPMLDNGTISRILVRVPSAYGPSEDFSQGRVTVFLAPWDERDMSTRDVIEKTNQSLRTIPTVRAAANTASSIGRGRGQPIQFVIAGDNYDDLARARDQIIARADAFPGLTDLDSDYKETKPQLMIEIDKVRAGDLGVSVNEIGRTLETMMGARRVTTYIERGEEYRVIVQADRKDRMSVDDLNNVYVRARPSGELVALSNLVNIRAFADAADLGRFNKLRAITLTANLAPGATLGDALAWLEAEAATIPEISAVGYKGDSLAFKQTGASIYIVFLFTLILVYLVMAAQFESFIHPGTIILTVPLAVAGGLLGLVAMGGTLNLYSQIGIVMLVGLAAKNGILIVEFANQLRDEGHDVASAIIEAATRRLRPILMTSIATVAGAVPLMLASGAGGAARTTIGIVIVWGVSLATLLTLFLIPAIYLRLARWTGSPLAVSRQLERELAPHRTGEEEKPL